MISQKRTGSSIVILFARRPCPGKVKKRLANQIGDEAACDIYNLLLRRTIGELDKLQRVECWLTCDVEADVPWFRTICTSSNWKFSHQVGNNIGERMEHAFTDHLTNDNVVILIGSDIADISFTDVERGLNLLKEGSSAVIGPSSDGGYWAIGLSSMELSIFDNVPWSTSVVLECTLKKMRKIGMNTKLLPIRTDIDRIEDLTSMLLTS